jgi:putative aldouronate transport system permease protein
MHARGAPAAVSMTPPDQGLAHLSAGAPDASARGSSTWRRLKPELYRYRHCYLLLLPAVIFFILFHYRPMYGAIIAFKDYRMVDGIMASPWVGLKHFEWLFGGYFFLRVLKNTLIISAYRIAFGFPAPILLALLLNAVRHLGFKKLVQSVSYLPHFMSWVILGGIVSQMLHPNHGVVNDIVALLGGERKLFLGDPRLFRGILIGTDVWQSVGWGSIVYLAAIASIDTEQYEASIIDGANGFAQARYITIPSIMPVIVILFILRVGDILEAGFDQILNLYNPAVYEVSDIIDTYVYRVGLEELNFSLAAAAGLFKNVIGLILVVIVNRIAKAVGDYGIW